MLSFTSYLNNAETGDSSELLELAKEQRMNTDVRKNIFCLIMTSEVNAVTVHCIWF